MSDDLVERLRKFGGSGRGTWAPQNTACRVAADRIEAMSARLAEVEAEARSWQTVAEANQATAQSHVERWAKAEAREAKHPGNLHWLAEDPECPLECWSSPIEERWEAAGTVFELMAAVSLPHIFVTERVLTVDDEGDPDETEPAWFPSRAAAEACYPESLARARATPSDAQEGRDT